MFRVKHAAAILICSPYALGGVVGCATPDDPEPDPEWDVTQPRGQTRQIEFVTDEGTWMSVDISPDGRWIVFDLLGHIYRVPAGGGEAESLTQQSGIAVNYHPRYSPDGREIAFVSDRAGQDGLWVMNADGSGARLVFMEEGAKIAEPTWTPDGRHIVATRRRKTRDAFLRTEDVIWMFPREGGAGVEIVSLEASGVSIASRSGDWEGPDRAQWPSVSPDGRHLYFHSSLFSGVDRRLRRLDLRTGQVEDVTDSDRRYLACCGQPADPVRLATIAPEISPDGRWLAFARKIPGGRTSFRGKQYMGRTALWLRDLQTGKERALMDPISNHGADMLDEWQTRVLPGYGWAQDGKSLVISQGGKIRRVWVETGAVETIPFRARVQRTISEMARGSVEITDKEFEARFLRWPASSPDGRQLVFEAVGQLWITELPEGTPRPLTDGSNGLELTPVWSPDGRRIAYATWDDEQGGQVWKIGPEGGRPVQLTTKAAMYLYPSWSRDGSSVVVNRWSPALARPFGAHGWESGTGPWELVRFPLNGGASEVIAAPGPLRRSQFGPNGELFAAEGASLLISLRPNGLDHRTLLEVSSPFGAVQDAALSPNGRWLAMENAHDVYVAALPRRSLRGGLRRVELDDSRRGVRRLSFEGGYHPRWRDERTLEFMEANRYFVFHVESGRMDTVQIRLRLPRAKPRGSIALTGARIVTLADDSVLENGTIVVRGSRIACVGNCDTSGADQVVDVRGKTIIPGLVETHGHHTRDNRRSRNAYRHGVLSQRRPQSAGYLAFGVTTVLDPGTSSKTGFPIAQLTEAGRIMGPRVYTVGESLRFAPYGTMREIHTYRDAAEYVRRLVGRGAITIKDRKQGTRTLRVMLAQAARDMSVSITSEGSDLEYLIGLIMDGYTGWEHPIQYVPIYSDVAKFFGQAGAHYSADILISDYPHGNALNYWMGQRDLWQDQKVLDWSPWQKVATRRTFAAKPLEEYIFPILAEGAADIMRAGGYPTTGAHGEQYGQDTHWELWSLAQAMSPMEVLTAASLNGARFHGLEREIGTIEVGKQADVVILDSNPLANIRNTTDIAYVMKGGMLYDANTLDQLWPERKPYGPRPWIQNEILRTDVRADNHWDRVRSPDGVERPVTMRPQAHLERVTNPNGQ